MAKLTSPHVTLELPTIEDAYEYFVVPNPELYTTFAEESSVVWDIRSSEWEMYRAGTSLTSSEYPICTHNDLVKMHLEMINSEEVNTEADPVEHPPHYTNHPSGIECIQVTEHMGFNLGNALKYIWRCDLKHDAIEDLRKAKWYLDREITKREKLL